MTDHNIKNKETKKNILIYTHMPEFSFIDGGTVVQYLLGKILNEYGQNVKMYPSSGIKTKNSIFSDFYNYDFPIDDNCVVIYSEGTLGNPLNAKNVVRWMLSKLGQNVPYSCLDTWNKNELVYYFNSETKIKNNPDKIGNIFKLMNVIFIHPQASNNNLKPRNGTCFTIRKAIKTHGKMPIKVHNNNALEITCDCSQIECIKIFNNHKYFISYDSITFLSILSALCGCISIVIKVDGLSKQDWLNTMPVADYLKESGETMLYGIAYGADEVQNATKTLHMATQQWKRIVRFSKNKHIKRFINDINNWEQNINTIQTNFYNTI
jgi:hypothetical protein